MTRYDGLNYLGLWYNALPEHQMALIISGCVPCREASAAEPEAAAAAAVEPEPEPEPEPVAGALAISVGRAAAGGD